VTLPLYDELRAEWLAATTERARAEVEESMWRQVGSQAPKPDPRDWIHLYVPECTVNEIEKRRRVFTARSLAETLWARIDGTEKMPASTAARLLTEARKRAVINGTSNEQALSAVLSDYDKLPTFMFKGKVFRKTVTHRQHAAVDRQHWQRVREAIRALVDHELAKHSDASTRAILRGQIDTEIDGLVKLLTRRVQRAVEDSKAAHNSVASSANAALNAERKNLRDACDTLSIDRPRSGIVDHALLLRAKKNFRALAKEHHPDHGGSAERYQAVVEAMTVVEASFRRETDTSANQHQRVRP
jgi:hypothetical protein